MIPQVFSANIPCVKLQANPQIRIGIARRVFPTLFAAVLPPHGGSCVAGLPLGIE